MNWCKVFIAFLLSSFLCIDLSAQEVFLAGKSWPVPKPTFAAKSGDDKPGLTFLADDFTRFVGPTEENARILLSLSDSLFTKTLLEFGYRSSDRGIAMEYLISSPKKTSHFRMIKRAGKGLVMTFSPSYSWIEDLVKNQANLTYRIEEDTEEYVGRTWAIKVLVVNYKFGE